MYTKGVFAPYMNVIAVLNIIHFLILVEFHSLRWQIKKNSIFRGVLVDLTLGLSKDNGTWKGEKLSQCCEIIVLETFT